MHQYFIIIGENLLDKKLIYQFILTSWTLWRWPIGGFCDLTSVCVSPHWLPAWLLSSTLPLAWRPDLYRFSNVICVLKVILRGQTLVDWGGSTDSHLVWFFVSGCMYFACALKLLPTKIMSFVHAYQYMQFKHLVVLVILTKNIQGDYTYQEFSWFHWLAIKNNLWKIKSIKINNCVQLQVSLWLMKNILYQNKPLLKKFHFLFWCKIRLPVHQTHHEI